MSRKTAFIIILIVISLSIGSLIGFYFYTKNKNAAPAILGRTTSGKTFGGYNPGGTNQSGNQADDSLSIRNNNKDESKVSRLREISKEPIAGAGFVSVAVYATSSLNIEPEDTSLTGGRVINRSKPRLIGYKDFIRFMERSTGNIYETSTSTKTNNRISNTTVPKIYEALFVGNTDSIILRDLVGNTDTIRTRLGTLTLSTTTDSTKSLVTSDLPIGISTLTLSPNTESVFSILNEGVTGYISKPDGGSKQPLLDISFREWLVDWPNQNNIVLTTKPSGFYPGFAYTLSPTTKKLNRIVGGINGLTTLMSPDASKVLIGQSAAGAFKMSVLDMKDGSVRLVPVLTFPEKCVWSKTDTNTLYCAVPEDIAFNVYPDVWYQGTVSFSDSIWSINIKTNETRLISKLADESGQVLDIQSISISPKDDYLLLTDKNTLHLWGLMLKEPPKDLFNILAPTGSTTPSSTRP